MEAKGRMLVRGTRELWLCGMRVSEYSRSRRTRTILARGFRAFLCDKSQGDPARVQVQKRNLKRDPRISPQNPERSEKLGEPRQALRDKRDLERSMESREIAGKPRNCRRSTEFREIPRIRRSFDRDPSRSSNSKRVPPPGTASLQPHSCEIMFTAAVLLIFGETNKKRRCKVRELFRGKNKTVQKKIVKKMSEIGIDTGVSDPLYFVTLQNNESDPNFIKNVPKLSEFLSNIIKEE
ncbi:hypothetical protein WN51_07420 [Melipona quadrifasciata]|uniref:Uncharacterized protein n=1 Tax=Melipona quadrifasciata TaxID=166423 RepID=A0A0N0BC24_9HYME|nr:hypothetical protein WN51_07420 [Melipona quadrifasciata]